MESEFERILKSEKKVQATAPPGVLLFLGAGLFFLGLVPVWLRIAGSSVTGAELAWVLAAFSFIAHYRSKQSRVNVELAEAIRDMRELLDQRAKEEDV